MNIKRRLLAVLVLLCLIAGVIYIGLQNMSEQDREQQFLNAPKETLRIWYTDDALSDYLSSVALTFYEEKGIRVLPVLTSGLEYMENIYDASVHTAEGPDLFIVSNDSLEKGYLAGLAAEIQDEDKICNSAFFPETALEAVTYHDKLIAYPFYYETSVFLYNKTYLEDMAEMALEAERDTEEGMMAEEAMEEAGSEEDAENTVMGQSMEQMTEAERQLAVAARVDEMIPKTIDEILAFADEYDAPEEVEAVLKWDVSDIFYNYFIVGEYMVVGGEAGDQNDNIDIYNQNTIDCLKAYQNLNQFFAIDTKEVTYAMVLQEFLEGKIVFSVVTTDAIAKLEAAKAEGTFAYEYGIAVIPDINDALLTKSLSVTNAVVVNGYSAKQELANEFAKYVTYDYSDSLYARTGKISSKLGIAYENENVVKTMDEYKKSISMPKMIRTSNLWVKLEICFTKVWLGANVNDELRTLSEQIMTQITGEPYTEEYIEEIQDTIPVEEYIDEGMEG